MQEPHVGALSRAELEAEVRWLRARDRPGGAGGDGICGDGHARASADGERQRAIFDSITEVAIVVTDADGRVTQWNSGAQRVLRWTAAEMLGASAACIFTPEDRAAGAVEAEMRTVLAHGRAADERWHVKRGGVRFWASGEMMPLRDADGTHAGFVKVLRDRTAEHLAGRALEGAEARLQQAQEAGGIGLFTLDVMQDTLAPTPEFCRLYGLPVRDHYPAAAFEERVIASDRHLASSAAAREGGVVRREVEYRVRRADTGELRWIARTGEMEFDDAGRAVCFKGVARDVTVERQAIDALARSEARYRALFDAIDDGFCIIEFRDGPHGPLSDYVHVEANPGYQRHTGITGIVGTGLREMVPPEDADAWVELYGEVLRTGQPLRFEREFAVANRRIEVSAARVDPPSRRQVSVLFRDITARAQAERALRQSEAVARDNIQRVQLALAAGAIIGTWHWDLPSDRFTVDEGFARAFGLDPALGREGLSLAQVVATVHPDDHAGLADAIGEAIARGGAYAHQYRVRHADGRYHWIEANGRVDHGADGTPLTFPGVLLDVDERRSLEAERDRAAAALRTLNDTLEQRVAARTAELMEAEEQLRQSQKIEAVGQLTGGVAHDFNNLLTVIRGSVDLLQRPALAAEKRARHLAAISDAADRAAKLTAQLLAFARRQALKAEVFDAAGSIAQMRDMIGTLAGSRVTVAIEVPARAFLVKADRSQFDTAIVNMAANARDAMGGQGTLTIGVAEAGEIPALRSHPAIPGRFIAVSIADTGAGIAPDLIDRIFEPFYTTKGVGHGTGLGLSQVFGFAKQSSGDVVVASEPGAGTTFTLFLPMAAETQDAGEADALPAPPLAQGACILVVEDNPGVGAFACHALEELGHATCLAPDAARALERLVAGQGGPGRFDLVFSDVVMPGMSGIELAAEIRRRWPTLPVVLTSGYSSVLAQQDDHDFEILRKPYALDELARTLARAAAGV